MQHDRERGFLIGQRAEIVLRAGDLAEAETLFGRAATLVDEDRREPLRSRREDIARWREESDRVRRGLGFGLVGIVVAAALGLFILRRRR